MIGTPEERADAASLLRQAGASDRPRDVDLVLILSTGHAEPSTEA